MKRRIISFDGTWNSPDQAYPSNVFELTRAIQRQSSGQYQSVHYYSGIGTGKTLDKLLGGLTGKGLSKQLFRAYTDLVDRYKNNDEVFLFGFSRGAYTACCLADLIGRIGLVRDRDFGAVRKLCQQYESPQKRNIHPWSQKGCSGKKIKIKFLGVWETVGAMGFSNAILRSLSTRKVGQTTMLLSPCIEHVFHALAIHEQRNLFGPIVFSSDTSTDRQQVQQCWFAGVHTNVGGGRKNRGLSNIALHWMADKARRYGVTMDETYLQEFVPSHLGKKHQSRNWFCPAKNHRIPLMDKTEYVSSSVSGLLN